MRVLDLLCSVLLVLSSFAGGAYAGSKSPKSVLLSTVKTLTLRKGLLTTHRRVSAVPQVKSHLFLYAHGGSANFSSLAQLKCIGGSGKGLYDIDVMRCKNQGSDYDDEK
jgi:hypothetical protein